MNIDIFGSCITRDAFEFNTNKYTVGCYNARSSLISAVSNPISEQLPEITTIKSNFKKKSVERDLIKSFSKYAKNPKSNTIIIDLFDERFDIFYYNESIFTFSNEYSKSGLNFKINRISKSDHLILFKENILKIIALFENYENIILHKIKPNRSYYNNKEIKQQKPTNHTNFLYNNIDYYFNLLEENIPNLKTIEIRGYIGDISHKWANHHCTTKMVIIMNLIKH